MTCRNTDRRRVAQATAALFVLVGALLLLTGTAFAAKVNPTPTPSSVTEGQSYNVAFTLDNPIISPMGSLDPNVTLSFAADDPSRLSFSPSTIQWTPSSWFQTRNLQVTAIADGVHDATDTDVVHVTATSDSVYYSGYTTSFTAVITDLDPAPTTTAPAPTSTIAPTTTAAPTTTLVDVHSLPSFFTTTTAPPAIAVAPATGALPATGAPIESTLVGGVIALAAGLALTRSKRRAHR
jgi:hypothetical protein